MRASQLVLFAVVPSVLVLVAALLWLGFRAAASALFARNDTFRIVRLELPDSPGIVRDYVRGKCGIGPGTNLFAFSVAEMRREFLAGAPNFKSMEISRILPGTLRVEVVERVPVARLGRRGHLAVDAEGVVFGVGTRRGTLAVVEHHDDRALRPGDRVDGLARDAVRLLDVCERMALGQDIRVRAIDVRGQRAGRDDVLRLYLDGGTTVDFWWHRRKHGGLTPSEDLRDRLLFLRGVLVRARKERRPLWTVNLTLDSYVDNCPVTPRWD
jgi:hypothetical protein